MNDPFPIRRRRRRRGGGAESVSDARPSQRRRVLAVPRFEQPDDVTCGPTCLYQVYLAYGEQRPFDEVLAATPRNPDGGTLAVYLGLTALRHGYGVAIYPYNLRVFDPTWFDLSREDLRDKLRARAATIQKPKLHGAVTAYARFLEEGGRIHFADLTPGLLVRILDRGHPVLCGLSSTYLYRQSRERPDVNLPDDVAGSPVGHFVVICGYSAGGQSFMIRDPQTHVPFSRSGRYVVPAHRLVNATLLGDVTYDAVLLELWPPGAPTR